MLYSIIRQPLIRHRCRLNHRVNKGVLFKKLRVNNSKTLSDSVVLGQCVVYFTMFYTSMNWWTFREARKNIEKKKD